jgi:hypothetical protein
MYYRALFESARFVCHEKEDEEKKLAEEDPDEES